MKARVYLKGVAPTATAWWVCFAARVPAKDSLRPGFDPVFRRLSGRTAGHVMPPALFRMAPIVALLLMSGNDLAQSLPPATTNSAGVLVFTNHYGDLNADTNVNVLDVVLLTHHLTGTQPLPPDQAAPAEVDQDGAVTETDRLILADMILNRRTGPDDDFDDDDLSNAEEIRRGTNPFQPDSDHDGWIDGLEVADGTDPLNPQSHGRLLAFAQPPVQTILPSADAKDGPDVFVGNPPVQTVLSALDGKDGSDPFVGNPPVRTILPSQDQRDGPDVVIGNPPVQTLMPLLDYEDGPEVVVGNPPVQIILPPTDDKGGPDVFAANPPVQMVLPDLDGLGGPQVFLANPPLQILLPDLDLIGVGGFGPYLARPPVTIRILQP
jgi:hypothetical protein